MSGRAGPAAEADFLTHVEFLKFSKISASFSTHVFLSHLRGPGPGRYRTLRLSHRRKMFGGARGAANADRAQARRAGGRAVVRRVRPAVGVHGGHRAGGLGALLLRSDGVERRHSGDQAASHPGHVALQRRNVQVQFFCFFICRSS